VSDFLDNMAKTSAARAAAAHKPPAADLNRPSFPLKLNGFDIIAELKSRSPSQGSIDNDNMTRASRACEYARGGAAAISVLTEPDEFAGDLAHLKEVVDATCEQQIPVMRKDFLVAPVQVLEAKAAGASGVLLIAAMLNDDALLRMLDCAFEHNLFVLLESFDQTDFDRSATLLGRADYLEQAGKSKLLFGINTRDLRTLEVNPDRLQLFAAGLPPRVSVVAESGQQTVGDISAVVAMGYDLALVGSALMKAPDPAALISDMLIAGRAKAS